MLLILLLFIFWLEIYNPPKPRGGYYSLISICLDYVDACLMVFKLLQIKDDAKHGFYVENLTEYVIKVGNDKAFKLYSFLDEQVSHILLN